MYNNGIISLFCFARYAIVEKRTSIFFKTHRIIRQFIHAEIHAGHIIYKEHQIHLL